MGAWGVGIFNNDDAANFATELADTNDISRLHAALDAVLRLGEDYLEVPQASEGLAAADVVARMRGRAGVKDAVTKAVDDWITRTRIPVSELLLSSARNVVSRVGRAPSELLDLWSEGELDKWLDTLRDLKMRLE